MWSFLCDHILHSISGYGIFIGQNLAWGYGTWSAAIEGWHSEVSMMHFGDSSLDISDVGHYTQVSIYRWTSRVVMVATFSFLLASEVVDMIMSGATRDDKVGIMTILGF